MHHHAGLGESEGQKRADGEERNEPVRDSAKDNEQQRRERDQHVNAPRVEQAPPADQENVGHVVVEGNGPREAGKIGKGSIGGERQHQQDRRDGEEIEPAVAHHRAGEHGEHALVARTAGIGGGDAVGAAQERNPQQQNRQQRNDDSQRGFGILARGVAEGHHAVAHRLHAGHGRASRREDFQDQPPVESRGDGRNRRHGRHWQWMPRRMHHLPSAGGNHDQQRCCKEISGNHEHHAGVVHAAHVHKGQDGEHDEAQHERVRLQGRDGGDQCAHAGRDAHCSGEDVVDHERCRGQKAGAFAQVLAGHGVGAAAARIGLDGLPVAEVDDPEQDHDRRAHGHDVFHAEKTERNQEGESRFRPVRGRAQRVEAKDRNPGQGADMLGAFLAGSQRTAEEQIETSCVDAHEPLTAALDSTQGTPPKALSHGGVKTELWEDNRLQDKGLRSEISAAKTSAAESVLIAEGERLERACSSGVAAGHRESQPLLPARRGVRPSHPSLNTSPA